MKKNILYISPNFNLACGVSKHVFTLLTSEELKKEFNLYFITNGGNALQRLDRAGISYSLMEFSTDKIFHFNLLKNLKFLKSYCREKEINIIHSHHRFPEFLSNTIKNALGIKTVVTAHNFVTGFKMISYKSDIIIAISNSVKNHLLNYFGINTKKIEVLYNCVGLEKSQYKNKEGIKYQYGIPQNHFVLLYAGRVAPEKGIETLLEAVKMLTNDSQKVFLMIVGNNKNLSELVKNKDILNNFLYLPPKENLSDLFSIADALILPSLKEGLGYTMLEAGLHKIPFIGSRRGGIAEFIENGINGYLFEPGDATELSEKIAYVLIHPDESASAADKLLKKVLRECNCTDYFRKLTEIYQHLLNR
ncbi:MAG: glycosyltransferase family 4 protein [Ignavibacteriaceae bacterium]|nr:glycosyltransferase family 4 protein [Ignavibacteriaceae bacterium]